MELGLRKVQDVYVIDVIGELDLYSTSKLKDLFTKMVDRNVAKLILNLDGVHYLDSSGVGTLLNIYSIAQKKQLRYTMANVHSSALKVMEHTRLTGFFPIEETLEAAIQSVSK